jgi:hypothetical protein
LAKIIKQKNIYLYHIGNIVDENDKSAQMLKCGTDKSPGAVAEIAERVKDDMLVRESHFITKKLI